MDKKEFEKIYIMAVNSGLDPIRQLGDIEFDIGRYLLKLLDKGKINDPTLVEKLMWYKAYNALNDIENE